MRFHTIVVLWIGGWLDINLSAGHLLWTFISANTAAVPALCRHRLDWIREQLIQGQRRQTLTYAMLLVISVIVGGCGPRRHIQVIESSKVPDERYLAVIALEDYPRDLTATAALVLSLQDSNASVRYAAVTALQDHIPQLGLDASLRRKALLAIVDLLDDARIGHVVVPTYGPLLPGMSGFTPSPRARALLVLTTLLLEDHGLDKDQWRKMIDQRFKNNT